MTLKEAHEIQRRELMSLRAENAHLKKLSSGLFPNEEKETLKRHIRHLEQVIKTEKNRHLQPFALVTLLRITTIQSGKQNTYTA